MLTFFFSCRFVFPLFLNTMHGALHLFSLRYAYHWRTDRQTRTRACSRTPHKGLLMSSQVHTWGTGEGSRYPIKGPTHHSPMSTNRSGCATRMRLPKSRYHLTCHRMAMVFAHKRENFFRSHGVSEQSPVLLTYL